MAIVHDNIIWIGHISKLGGVESFAYYFAKKYKDLDIAVMCKSGDINQLERIRKYCPAYVHHGEQVICKTIITNCDISILDYATFDNCYMVIHADYSQPCYKVFPEWHDERITKVLTITKYTQQIMKEKFGIDTELCPNPLVPEEDDKPIVLVSATRLSKIKGGTRMKALAEELDLIGCNYIWYVFTNDSDCIHSKNVIFLQERLDVYRWLQHQCDIVVQLSDTECRSYTIDERTNLSERKFVLHRFRI